MTKTSIPQRGTALRKATGKQIEFKTDRTITCSISRVR